MAQKDLLVAWLNDAYSAELAQVPVLENHAKDAQKYKHIRERDLQHLEETRRHAELVKGCIERLGESTSTLKAGMSKVFGTAQSVATGPFKDELIKNFLSDYAAEHFEIASYKSLIAAAQEVGDQETARVCQEILRDEEEMARWLDEHIAEATQLTMREKG